MKILVPKNSDVDYPSDVERIQKIFFARDFLVTVEVAEYAWNEYSNSVDAGWISMYGMKDDDIFNSCMIYLKEI